MGGARGGHGRRRVAAYTITNVVRHQWSIAVAVTILAAFVPHHLQHRSLAAHALIALVIPLGHGLAALNLTEMHGLFTERLEDVLLGAGLAVIGTVAGFPRDVQDEDLALECNSAFLVPIENRKIFSSGLKKNANRRR